MSAHVYLNLLGVSRLCYLLIPRGHYQGNGLRGSGWGLAHHVHALLLGCVVCLRTPDFVDGGNKAKELAAMRRHFCVGMGSHLARLCGLALLCSIPIPFGFVAK